MKLPPKLILHCLSGKWNLNKNFKKREKGSIVPPGFKGKITLKMGFRD